MLSGILLLLLHLLSTTAFHAPSHTVVLPPTMLSSMKCCRGALRTPVFPLTRMHQQLPLRLHRALSASTGTATPSGADTNEDVNKIGRASCRERVCQYV